MSKNNTNSSNAEHKTISFLDRIKGIFLGNIHNNERSTHNSMSIMFFFSLFSYYLLRPIKDNVIMDLGGGSSLIGVIKFIGTLPVAIIVSFIYGLAVSKFDQNKVAKFFSFLFAAILTLYAIVIFPNMESFYFSEATELSWAAKFEGWNILGYPISEVMRSLVKLVAKYPATLFYILSEIYGTVTLSLIFWNFANQHASLEQSKRWFPVFIVRGQMGTTASGLLILFLEKILAIPTITVSCISIFLAALSALAIAFYQDRSLENIGNIKVALPAAVKKEKTKLPFIQALRVLFRYRYIALITYLVLCYGACMGLTELCWKDLVYVYCAKVGISTQLFFGEQTLLLGLVALAFSLTFQNFFKNTSWGTTAIATPVMLGTTTVIFFASGIFAVGGSILLLSIAVLAGLIQNNLSKTTKYAFFDTTKESAFIVVDEDLRSVAKSTVDVIGSRLGKALSGFFGFVIITPIYGQARNCLPLSGCIVFSLLCLWIYSVIELNKLYVAAYSKQTSSHTLKDNTETVIENK